MNDKMTSSSTFNCYVDEQYEVGHLVQGLFYLT